MLSNPLSADEYKAALRMVPDGIVRAPLWEYEPARRPLILRERRRRFGVFDEEVGDPEYG